MRRRIKNSTKRLLILYASVTAGIVAVIVGVYVTTTLLGIPKAAVKNYDLKQLGYSYHIVQRPGTVISGKPVTFEVVVKDANGPVSGHAFKAGTSHGYGLFANPRTADIVDKAYITDSQGRFTFKYQSNFFDLRPDTFGFGVAPIFTPSEQEAYYRKIQNGELRGNEPLGPTVSFTIYPKWIGWFKK
jgi:hypothetical protein